MTDEPEILRQRPWTEAELAASGFSYFQQRKKLVMARELPEDEAPKVIQTPTGPLVVQKGWMICYLPGETLYDNLDDYGPWPVRRDLFEAIYRPWDESGFCATPTDKFLMDHGCAPYYKATGVWAKRLTEPMRAQSLESPEPVPADAGDWLCIGPAGEPWCQADEAFRERYKVG